MKISTRLRYGVLMLAALAENYEQQPIILKDIASKQGVSVKYLEQLIIPLKIGRFIRNIRGKGGGYMLNRAPAEINLAEIVTALEGSSWPVESMVGPVDAAAPKGSGASAQLWWEIKQELDDYLKSITLQDIIERQSAVDLKENVQQNRTAAQPVKSQKIILIIDRDEVQIQAKESILRSRNYMTLPAYNARDALKLARQYHPDLIIMGITMLPDKEGRHLSSIIRNDRDLAKIPILLVSEVGPKDQYLKKHPETDPRTLVKDGLIQKPFAPLDLLSEVARLAS